MSPIRTEGGIGVEMKRTVMSDSHGQMLIGVLIAMGLIGILAYALTALITQTMLGQKNIEQHSAVYNLNNEVYDILADPPACLNTFTSGTKYLSSATTYAVTQIKDSSTPAVVMFEDYSVSGATYESNTIRINAITFQEYTPRNAAYYYEGTAYAVLSYQKQTKTLGSQVFKEHKVRLDVSLDANKRLLACHAIGGTNDNIYLRETAATDGIYYDAGKVGFGVNIPQTQLDVKGELRLVTDPGDVTPCSAATSGRLRYHEAAGEPFKYLEFCNGAAWNPLGVYWQ